MIRHDAENDFEVLHDQHPSDPEMPGMDFPLPVQGNRSPNRLALAMLATISFKFGFFVLLIRLIGLSYPDVAVILSYIVAGAFAIAFGITLFVPERALTQWPIWVGAAVILFLAADRYFPNSVLTAALPGTGFQQLAPIIFQIGIGLTVIVIYLSPAVKTLLATKTRGSLVLGAFGCLTGGAWSTADYVPESDFGAWNYLAVMLVAVWWAIVLITDQYARFEQATNPSRQVSDEDIVFPRWLEALPVQVGLFAPGPCQISDQAAALQLA